jgi:hypothetical protein
MRTFAQLLTDIPPEEVKGLAAYIVMFLTDDEFPDRSSFLGIPPSQSEVLEAINGWIAQEKVLN